MTNKPDQKPTLEYQFEELKQALVEVGLDGLPCVPRKSLERTNTFADAIELSTNATENERLSWPQFLDALDATFGKDTTNGLDCLLGDGKNADLGPTRYLAD
jgi:hypothetical protein